MIRNWGCAFVACAVLTAFGASQTAQPDVVDGTKGRLLLVTDQRSPARIQSATENPKTAKAWLSIRSDVPQPVDAITVAVIVRSSSNASVRILKSDQARLPPTADDTVLVEMRLLDDKALDALPPGSTAEVGITKVTFSDGKTWTWDVQAKGGFDRLPPDSPLLRVRPFFERDDQVFRAAEKRAGCTMPTPIRSASPKYTQAAMDAKLQGTVELDAIVLADGTVGKVRVTASLDRYFGLDREAVYAARQWKFKPGTCQGVPVDTVVGLLIEFRVH